MYKRIALAAALVAGSQFALAQSSVTLYGVADVGVGQVKSPGLGVAFGSPAAQIFDRNSAAYRNSQGFQMLSSSLLNNVNSQIGFRGVEDIGGGAKVGFRLEDGLSLKDGSAGYSGGQFFSRQANVWVQGGWGQLTLGRAFNPWNDALYAWDLTGIANYSVPGNAYFFPAGTRVNSQFKYSSPNFNGFSAEGAYVFRDNNVVNGRQLARWDIAGFYRGGPVSFAIDANQQKGSPTNYTVGGNYKFGSFKLAASYNAISVAYANPELNLPLTNFRRRGVTIGASYQTGPYTLTAQVNRDLKHDTLQMTGAIHQKKYTDALIEGKYSLSKSTFFYVAFLHFDGDNNYVFGLRHNF